MLSAHKNIDSILRGVFYLIITNKIDEINCSSKNIY